MTAAATAHEKPARDVVRVDRLVVSTVNVPFKRRITAAVLQECIATNQLDEWLVHVANFFTDVSLELILEFADVHGISRSQLADAYRAMKAQSGQQNPDLEAKLGSLAPSPA